MGRSSVHSDKASVCSREIFVCVAIKPASHTGLVFVWLVEYAAHCTHACLALCVAMQAYQRLYIDNRW